MIRDATISDWPALYALGQRLVARTPYSHLSIDRERTLKVYGQCLSSALGFAKVSESDGQITGVLLGIADRLWWSKARYASDLVFYCEDGRSGLPLMRAFVEWAWSIPGVVEITMGRSSGIDVHKTDALYRRCGFEKVGSLWMKQRQ